MRVLVARLDNGGDVLLMGPAIRAVASRATVTLLCGPRGRDAASLLPGVSDLMVFRADWIDPEPHPIDPAAMTIFVGDIAARRFDEAIILTSFHQSPLPLALLLRMAGVGRIGAICDDYPGSLLDVRHRVGDDMHEVQRALSLVNALGYTLPPGDDARLRIERRTPPAIAPEPPYVVVHPGASVPARAWPPERNAQLVNALVWDGRRVVVTGSPSERELTAHVAGEPREQVHDLGGRLSLAELGEVLARADALVVGNTGPAHLAAAVGTPVVSIFAPTVPATRWRPWGVPHVLLGEQDIECAGCRARECPIEGQPCTGSVLVREVVTAVRRIGRSNERRVVLADPAWWRAPVGIDAR